jgi:hypothetical protein
MDASRLSFGFLNHTLFYSATYLPFVAFSNDFRFIVQKNKKEKECNNEEIQVACRGIGVLISLIGTIMTCDKEEMRMLSFE